MNGSMVSIIAILMISESFYVDRWALWSKIIKTLYHRASRMMHKGHKIHNHRFFREL